MDIYHSPNGAPCLMLTTAEEVEIVSLVANNGWAEYPTVLHPIKRSVHRDLARRAFAAVANLTSDIAKPFPLTSDETAIVAGGVSRLENALLKLDEKFHYTTNTMSRDATALCLAEVLRNMDTTE